MLPFLIMDDGIEIDMYFLSRYDTNQQDSKQAEHGNNETNPAPHREGGENHISPPKYQSWTCSWWTLHCTESPGLTETTLAMARSSLFLKES